MTSVVQVVPGPVVECPPTAADSPEPISSENRALGTASSAVRREANEDEFARMEEQLGKDNYAEILLRHGVRAVPAIRSLVLARRIYREMLAQRKASANRQGK